MEIEFIFSIPSQHFFFFTFSYSSSLVEFNIKRKLNYEYLRIRIIKFINFYKYLQFFENFKKNMEKKKKKKQITKIIIKKKLVYKL